MSIFFGILAFIFAIVAAIVVLSYAFVWYEFANREPECLEISHRILSGNAVSISRTSQS